MIGEVQGHAGSDAGGAVGGHCRPERGQAAAAGECGAPDLHARVLPGHQAACQGELQESF